MAATLQRAGARIARRAMAAGLGGLSIALFVGVMAFAFATAPAERPAPASDTVLRYLPLAGRALDLEAIEASLERIVEAFSAPPEIRVNDQALLATRIEAPEAVDVDFGGEDRPWFTEPFPPLETPEEYAPVRAVAAAVRTPPPAPAAPASTPVAPSLGAGEQVQATVSFYYCERGTRGFHLGDGGGFCGAMRDGDIVYPGAAACAYQYLGQQFRIVGDPLERVYTCADTGSAVHGLHRDIWFMNSDDGWAWQRTVGQVATLEILR
ncbi:MAG: hypothetical protein WD058_00985 [Dehalococcoidia bacterium]